jgi:hypothetical protein
MNNNLHYVFSVNAVAYLSVCGIEPVEVKKSTETGKIMFMYERTQDFFNTMNKYKDDEFIQKFIVALKNTKKNIHMID